MKHFLSPWFSLLLITGQFIHAQQITTFDVPGGTYLFPTGISSSGEIVGYFENKDHTLVRGFLRNPNGTVTIFDAASNAETFPMAVNPEGQIIGNALLSSDGLIHAFTRDAKGVTKLFNFPGVNTQTQPEAINPKGMIVGAWINYDGPYPSQTHGFLRDAGGKLTTVDVGGTDYPDTWLSAINESGQSVGYFDNFDVAGQEGHAFLRGADGTITRFDALNATATYPVAINTFGQIAGNYVIQGLTVERGFLRNADRTITTFGVPGAATNGTVVMGMDAKGRIAGFYVDTFSQVHGFVRRLDGTFLTFDVPGAIETMSQAMNSLGEVVGLFRDAEGKQHGFVLTE